MFSGNSLWHLISQTDTISKIVLLSLIGMSISCWTIVFYKLILMRIKKKQLHDAIARIKKAQTLDDLLTIATQLSGTMPGLFIGKNLVTLKSLLEVHKFNPHADVRAWELMQQQLYTSIDEFIVSEETYMPFLSTSAASAPLVGLFGTVWGLIHAFVGISEKQSADIAAVAPGIAEALITTLAGLVVAIPALVMYSYLNTKIRELDQQLVTLADKFGIIAQSLFLTPFKSSGFTAQQPKEPNAII